jgi:hypothetical protein
LQLVANDGTGAPTLSDMGVEFRNRDRRGADLVHRCPADLPAAMQFLSPRLFLDTGATAAAVAYDCAGVYLETDF